MTITLPWPNSKMTSNARGAWYTKEDARQETIETAYWTAYLIDPGGLDFTKPLQLHILACPPDKRKRDLFNVVDSLKYYIDGVAKAKGFNDVQIRKGIEEWGAVYPHGQVILTFTEYEA